GGVSAGPYSGAVWRTELRRASCRRWSSPPSVHRSVSPFICVPRSKSSKTRTETATVRYPKWKNRSGMAIRWRERIIDYAAFDLDADQESGDRRSLPDLFGDEARRNRLQSCEHSSRFYRDQR